MSPVRSHRIKTYYGTRLYMETTLMGMLARFDMNGIADRYGARHFVETGTGDGAGLAHASKCRAFDLLWSCEFEPTIWEHATEKFRYDRRIKLFNQPSSIFLANMVDLLPSE